MRSAVSGYSLNSNLRLPKPACRGGKQTTDSWACHRNMMCLMLYLALFGFSCAWTLSTLAVLSDTLSTLRDN